MNKLHYIYGLKDPRTDEIRYIGKTSQTLIRRWQGHLSEKENTTHNLYKYKWIRSLLENNYYPQLIILDKVEDWDFWERFYIQKYKKLGNKLTNLTRGGNDFSKTQKEYVKNQSKKVYSLNIEILKVEEHKSVIKAAEELDISSHNICSAIHTKGKCKNRFWSYEPIDENFELNSSNNHQMVIVTYENGFKIFPTIRESMKKLGFKYTIKNSVYKSLNKGITYKGYKWMRLDGHIKLGELLGSLEEGNQQPSTNLNG